MGSHHVTDSRSHNPLGKQTWMDGLMELPGTVAPSAISARLKCCHHGHGANVRVYGTRTVMSAATLAIMPANTMKDVALESLTSSVAPP